MLVREMVDGLEKWEKSVEDGDAEKKRLEKEKQKKLKQARRMRDAQEKKREQKPGDMPEDEYAEEEEEEAPADSRFTFVREGIQKTYNFYIDFLLKEKEWIRMNLRN